MLTDAILKDTESRMDNSFKSLESQLSGIRTGKASPALVENIQVTYYGAPTRIRDLANISTPEMRLITISPYDPSILGDIERAILAANIGVTPLNDGRLVRVPIPELSEERRKEMTKVANRMAEEARVAIRNVRRDANDAVKAMEKKREISEDEMTAALASVQKATDAAIAKVDKALKAKEAEVMAV